MKKFTTLSDFPLLSLYSIRVRCKRRTCAGQRWYLLSNSKWTHHLTLCKHPAVGIGRSLLKWPACNSPCTFPRGLSETRTVYIGAVRILFSCSEKKEMTTTTAVKKKYMKIGKTDDARLWWPTRRRDIFACGRRSGARRE